MEEIAIFQRNVSFSRKWGSEGLEMTHQEIEIVLGFETRLEAWKEELDRFDIDPAKRCSVGETIPMVYVLQIVCW